MALVDRGRRFVAANDAALELYQQRPEQIIGRPATSGRPGPDPAVAEAAWDELMRSGALYGHEVIHFSSTPMRVSYAAHTIELDGEWRALFVVLSARRESDGEELVGPVTPAAASSPPDGSRYGAFSKGLTVREAEIVRQVALGRSTPQIAAELNLSPATVRSHVRNAMVKAGAHTRAQLVAVVLADDLARE